MKILVPIKRVLDANAKLRVRPDGSGVDLSSMKMSINPFCEIAVEEAVRMKERGETGDGPVVEEIVAVSIGPDAAQETLRTALAMGADRGILIRMTGDVEPLTVAKLLKKIVETEQPTLALLGKQAIDDDNNATGQMLAALLKWPQATFASKIQLSGPAEALVTREIDGGLQTINIALPAVVTADLRLNEPRYASLPNIMKAKKKPLEVLDAADLGVDTAPRLALLATQEPPARKQGKRVESVAELVSDLKNVGVI